MNRPSLTDLALITLVAVSAIAASHRGRGFRIVTSAYAQQSSGPTTQVARRSAGSADRARSPFRLSNDAPALRYGETPPATPAPAPPEPSRPPYSFELKAIVGGPPWLALLSGLPGTSGDHVVRSGDVFADLRIEEITGDRIRIAGTDTSWTLSLPERSR